MTRLHNFSRWAVALLMLAVVTAAAAEPRWRPGRVLVKRVAGARESGAASHAAAGARLVRHLQSDVDLVEAPAGVSVPDLIARYQADPDIQWAEPDYIVNASATPVDPSFAAGELWGLHNVGQDAGVADVDINAPSGWDIRSSAASVIVAVIDTGVRYTHADLSANMWRNPGEIAGNGRDDDGNGLVDDVFGINAVAGTGNPMDDNGHGSHVAGTIGAVGNNSVGVVGVAWQVQIMACKFLDQNGEGAISDAIDCIDYAVAHGARVLNNSWGGGSYSQAMSDAISRARAAGAVFVAAAGNESTNLDVNPAYPACYTQGNVIAVASVTRRGELSSFSNYGATRVDLAAPGSSIKSTWYTSDTAYNTISGTSMATPHVSGAAALLLAQSPALTADEAVQRLIASTEPLSALAGRMTSGGILKLDRLLSNGLLADFEVSTTGGAAPLAVQFTDRSIGAITGRSWNFGDGSSSTAVAPAHTYTANGRYTATLTVAGSNGGVDSRSIDIVVSPQYSVAAVPYSWHTPVGESTLTLADDGTVSVTAPFPLSIYGEQSDTLVIGANGLMGAVGAEMSAYNNSDLPQAAAPNGMVCLFWDDLNPAGAGRVVTHTEGVSPNRRFIVTWDGVPHYQDSAASFSFQAVWFEGSSAIEYQYKKVSDAKSSVAGGASATIGIESRSGDRAIRYLYNGSPALITDQSAIRFSLPEDARVSIAPAGSVSLAGTVGGPFTPAGGSAYTLSNSGSSAAIWSASVDQSWITLSKATGTIAAHGSDTLTATLNSAALILPAGLYVARINFEAAGAIIGELSREIRLVISASGGAGLLTVSPDSPFVASGPEGGPFSPGSRIYTVTNTGAASVGWRADRTGAWLVLSPNAGTLAPGESTDVAASIAPEAGTLAADSYAGTVSFTNVTTGLVFAQRNATLTIFAGDFPESPHPYINGNCDPADNNGPCEVESFTYPGNPVAIAVTFDSRTEVENGYDYIILLDVDLHEVGKIGGYTGTELAGQTIIITGDTVHIGVSSDSSLTGWGYRVTTIRPIDPNALPESFHPYTNNFDYTWDWDVAPAESALFVTFSAETSVERRYDYIGLYDGNGLLVDDGAYTGTQLAGMTAVVPGSHVSVRLESDSTITDYGFRVTEISGVSSLNTVSEAETAHPYPHNAGLSWRVSRTGATSLRIRFDRRTSVEDGYDFIAVRDSAGAHISGSPFTGAELAGAEITVPGDIADLSLSSDDTVHFFGLRVESVIPEYPVRAPLLIHAVGDGDGRVLINGSVFTLPVAAQLAPGTAISLKALAEPGCVFNGWGGDLVTAAAATTLSLDAATTLTVNFNRTSSRLSVEAGWNLVGMPMAESRSFATLFAANASLLMPQIWQVNGRRLQPLGVDGIPEVGRLYWLHAAGNAESLALAGLLPADTSLHLAPGHWLMATPSVPVRIPLDWGGFAWEWRRQRFVPVPAGTRLQPGRGYWLYSPTGIELTPD